MAHIVDKEENLRRFIDAMNNSSSIFTRSKNFGKSSKDVSTSSTPPTALSPTVSPTAMAPIEGHPASPSPLHPALDVEDDSPNVLSSRDMNQLPNTPPSKTTEPDHFEWTTPAPSFNIQQSQDHRSAYPDSLVHKLLTSPQLTGTLAPPPTPETAPHITTENNEDIEEIVATQVNKHFANKTNAAGLGESIHAPHRSSPLTGGWVRSNSTKDEGGNTRLAVQDRKLSDETRRLRELSFERASFKAADSPSESGSFAKAAETATTASGTQGANRMNTVPPSNATDWVPPHLRTGENAPVSAESTATEPKPQANDGNYASTMVKKMEAGTKSFLAKWGVQKPTLPDHTPTSWEDHVQPESRDEPVETPASSVASTTDEETRVVYTPAELVAIKPQDANEKPAVPVVDPVPVPVHMSPKPEVDQERPSTVAETLPTEPDVSFLPPHLRIGPSSSVAAQQPKQAPSGYVTKEKPSVTQPPQALPTAISSNVITPPAALISSASKVTLSSAKDQNSKTSSLDASTLKPSPAITRQLSSSSPGYISGAKAVATAAKALGKDGALFFKSYPKPESRGRPVARIRKAIITHLPPRCTAEFVASLVYGGPIESIIIKPNSVAEVIFVNAQDCTQFCTDNDNGLEYGTDKDDYVLVDMNTDVDVVGGKLQEMIDNGVTRCVRVIGVDHEWTKERLWVLGEKRNSRLEHLEDTVNEAKIRTVTFRFCKMDDANTFKAILVRDEDWEQCNVRFAPDPCATAQGVHFGD